MLKKLTIAVMVIFIVIASNNIRVYADQSCEQNSVYVEERTKDNSLPFKGNICQKILWHILNARYDWVPTNLWDITYSGSYYFFFDGMQYYTNTNYYFLPNANGQLCLIFDEFDSEHEEIKIKLFKVGESDTAYEWTGNPENMAWIRFNGLNQNSNYYIKFEAYESPYVTGSGWISHSVS